MNRFSRLEFGDASGPSARPPGAPVRNAEYYCQEAARYWLGGDYEIALRHYGRALEENPTRFDAWAGQVLMLIELGEYPEARLWADKALESFPEHPELLALKAIACTRDAHTEQAVAYSDNSLAKDNLTPRVWLARAEVFANRKGPLAEGCLSKAVTLAGDLVAIVKLEAGRLLSRKHNFLLAIQYLKEAIQLLPPSALAWYELGCCQAAVGLPDAAYSLEQSLQCRPGWKEAETALRQVGKKRFFKRR
jgi:tetratricopeptide (TPR) repeat protein